jgi:hypothetical protein
MTAELLTPRLVFAVSLVLRYYPTHHSALAPKSNVSGECSRALHTVLRRQLFGPGKIGEKARVQEVTGGVTNYVARLPEVANAVDEWKASLEAKPVSQLLAPSIIH